MPKKEKKQVNNKKVKLAEDSKLFAFLAVFLCIVGFIIALLAKKDDKYVIYYAKQSLILFISFLIVSMVTWIPVIGWITGPILTILLFILWIIALVYSVSGEMKETPIIGQFARQINL